MRRPKMPPIAAGRQPPRPARKEGTVWYRPPRPMQSRRGRRRSLFELNCSEQRCRVGRNVPPAAVQVLHTRSAPRLTRLHYPGCSRLRVPRGRHARTRRARPKTRGVHRGCSPSPSGRRAVREGPPMAENSVCGWPHARIPPGFARRVHTHEPAASLRCSSLLVSRRLPGRTANADLGRAGGGGRAFQAAPVPASLSRPPSRPTRSWHGDAHGGRAVDVTHGQPGWSKAGGAPLFSAGPGSENPGCKPVCVKQGGGGESHPHGPIVGGAMLQRVCTKGE